MSTTERFVLAATSETLHCCNAFAILAQRIQHKNAMNSFWKKLYSLARAARAASGGCSMPEYVSAYNALQSHVIEHSPTSPSYNLVPRLTAENIRPTILRAAKARGLEVKFAQFGHDMLTGPWIGNTYWNPCTDIGTAFYLACDLGLSFGVDRNLHRAICGTYAVEFTPGNEREALCHVITIAAAAKEQA